MLANSILVEVAPGQTRLAFCDDAGKIQEIWHCRDDQLDLFGSVHIARIEQLFLSQNRAQARLADKTVINLRVRKIDRHGLVAGTVLPITVTAAPRQGKVWQALPGIRLMSSALILLPGQSGMHFSKNIDSAAKARLVSFFDGFPLPDGFAVILRRRAARLSQDALHTLLSELVDKWQSGLIGCDMTKPAVMHHGGSIKDQALHSVLFATLCACKVGSPNSQIIDIAVAEALRTKVPLPGGGVLWCQRTNALWAIDIDSGSANINRFGFEGLLNEAAKESARQIRLRGMSGPIIIDVPSSGSGAKKFAKDLQHHLDSDPQSPNILGITRSGMLEVWRPHGRKALTDVMADNVAQAAFAGLRLVAARPAFKPVRLAVNVAIARWLNNAGKPAVDKLDQRLELVLCLNDEVQASPYIIDSANTQY